MNVIITSVLVSPCHMDFFNLQRNKFCSRISPPKYFSNDDENFANKKKKKGSLVCPHATRNINFHTNAILSLYLRSWRPCWKNVKFCSERLFIQHAWPPYLSHNLYGLIANHQCISCNLFDLKDNFHEANPDTIVLYVV